jgi:hypothetical protein
LAVAWLFADVWRIGQRDRRRRRESEELRHITGATPWWGRR